MAYCDDVKPAITSIEEFSVADKGAALFESAAGTRLILWIWWEYSYVPRGLPLAGRMEIVFALNCRN